MKALVLGGGSVRGAYEAGAIRAVLEYGYVPKLISANSVGSINGMFLVNLSGKQKVISPTQDVDYKKIGKEIWNLWLNEIKKPSDIVLKRKAIPLAWGIMRHKFNGFLSNKPLKKLINKHIEYRFLQASPIDIYSGTVDLDSGKIIYANKSLPDYIDYAISSTAIPLIMPPSIIKHKPYCDSGLIDSAPLKIAFDMKASEIICIANSPENLGSLEVQVGRPIKYAERCLDIVLNNSLNNDIREAELINSISPENGSKIAVGIHTGKKRIPLKIIRPESTINVDIMSFDKQDIRNMLELGYENAKKSLNLNQ